MPSSAWESFSVFYGNVSPICRGGCSVALFIQVSALGASDTSVATLYNFHKLHAHVDAVLGWLWSCCSCALCHRSRSSKWVFTVHNHDRPIVDDGAVTYSAHCWCTCIRRTRRHWEASQPSAPQNGNPHYRNSYRYSAHRNDYCGREASGGESAARYSSRVGGCRLRWRLQRV